MAPPCAALFFILWLANIIFLNLANRESHKDGDLVKMLGVQLSPSFRPSESFQLCPFVSSSNVIDQTEAASVNDYT